MPRSEQAAENHPPRGESLDNERHNTHADREDKRREKDLTGNRLYMKKT